MGRPSKRTAARKACGLKSGIRQFGATSSNWMIWSAKRTTPPARRHQQEGTGTEFGRGRKHWSQALLHQSSFSPYPFELEFVGVDKVAFVWDELCDKCNQPNEKVGSYEVATFCGKPAAPDHTASSAEDLLASSRKRCEGSWQGRCQPASSALPPNKKSSTCPVIIPRVVMPSGLQTQAQASDHRRVNPRDSKNSETVLYHSKGASTKP